ncbi:Thioredoxin reductase [Tenacibaculum sp. MAR_2009_124]|uniref:NAD(P)/FAD-dependent oxidoreductase n=1 Tax=Tenacibaculum sp. MAR_2009_124 TaxID=1250059 RepID=UPI00089A9D49|nr:NAD(P)/FAD-dependent oxidoreductase [Tenacibaculum sp. MAR_2009_124]SEC87113.1 Thioredoxin reductase [Tenacibaculum sp. MAR_2009_124]
MENNKFEVIVIGGGPAGMSAALVLGRSRIRTLVLNTENPRNNVTKHSHGFLTQDGKHPTDIFKEAKKQLNKYSSVEYRNEKAIDLIKIEDGFQVKTEFNAYKTKRVVVATGHRDNIESIGIDGLVEVYGKSVYPCPFCDGFEMADKKLAVIGDAVKAPMFSKVISHWSNDVIVFTNGDKVVDIELIKSLKSKNIEIIEDKIIKLHSLKGKLISIELDGGESVEREGGFLPDTKSQESTNFAHKMRIPSEEGRFGMSFYVIDENKETEVPGFYIVGDAQTGWSGVAVSVAEGSKVGSAITHQIIMEKWKN